MKQAVVLPFGKTSINGLSVDVDVDVVVEETGKGFGVTDPPQTGRLDIILDEGGGVV